MARGRAYHAAEARPIGASEFEKLGPDHLDRICIHFHPSVSLLSSPHPVVSIWEAHREDGAANQVAPGAAEAALIARPFLEVEVWRIPPGSCAFLSSLGYGHPLGEAAAAGLAAEPGFDLAANLMLLIKSSTVVGLHAPESISAGKP